jgi:hypothetical protein
MIGLDFDVAVEARDASALTRAVVASERTNMTNRLCTLSETLFATRNLSLDRQRAVTNRFSIPLKINGGCAGLVFHSFREDSMVFHSPPRTDFFSRPGLLTHAKDMQEHFLAIRVLKADPPLCGQKLVRTRVVKEKRAGGRMERAKGFEPSTLTLAT